MNRNDSFNSNSDNNSGNNDNNKNKTNTGIYKKNNEEGCIRNVKETDAPDIAAIYRYYVENTTITFEAVAPTTEEMAGRIKKYTQKYPWIVMESEGEIVGYAYACAFRERVAYRFTVEMSVYLSMAHCKKGYGRALAEVLLTELEKRGFYTVIAGITATNQPSISLFKKLGFEPCANLVHVGYKNEEWLSVRMMSKALQSEYGKSPSEPESLVRNQKTL